MIDINFKFISIYALIIFLLYFIILFKENFNKKFIPLYPRPKNEDYPLRIRLAYTLIRSSLRSIYMTISIVFITSFLYYICLYLFNLGTSAFIIIQDKQFIDILIEKYNELINSKNGTHYTSLLIAAFFSIIRIILLIFNLLKEIAIESHKETKIEMEKEEKLGIKFSLDREISKTLNFNEMNLKSYYLKKVFTYKNFIFAENIIHIISIYILWQIKDIQITHSFILVISLIIISYSSLLRILGDYLHIIKNRLTLIHKIYIHIISLIIPLSTIILTLLYFENKNKYELTILLFIISTYSFIALNFGEKLIKKHKKFIEKEIEEDKKFKNFLRLF